MDDSSLVKSFSNLIGMANTRLMFSMEVVFSEAIHPVFNCGKFPSKYHAYNCDSQTKESFLETLFSARNRLTIEMCEAYISLLVSYGFNYSVYTDLSGSCRKASAPKVCKPLDDRFTCAGCGIVYVPNSLRDKACVVHKDPWWFPYLKSELEADIQQAGGISKTDPLVIFPDGTRRHGRTVNGRDPNAPRDSKTTSNSN